MVNRPPILPVSMTDAVVRKRGNTILDGIGLTLGPTGMTIIMGPNGSGKTTLLRLLNGLERLRSGHIQWGCDAGEARKRQAFVFQIPILMRRTVLDNIAYPLKVRGEDQSAAREAAKHWANEVGLGKKCSLEAQYLSGGERQKLAIARALITEPDLLSLDEPTTNLDGISTREIEALLQRARDKGERLIMTTHDVGQAKRLATEVVFINRGKICEHTTAEEFFISPQTPEAQAYLRGDIVE